MNVSVLKISLLPALRYFREQWARQLIIVQEITEHGYFFFCQAAVAQGCGKGGYAAAAEFMEESAAL